MNPFQKLLDERAALVAENRKLLDKLAAENREWTGEEQTEYEARDKAIDAKSSAIAAHRKQAANEAALKESLGRQADRDVPPPTPRATTETVTFRKGTRSEATLNIDLTRPQNTAEYRSAFTSFLVGNGRMAALQADVDTSGGYTVAPQQFVAELIKSVDDLLFIRRMARVIPVVGAASLGAASLDADPADADWTSEILTGSEDSTMAFGKRELAPWPLAKLIKVSRKLIRQSALPADQLVRERLAYKFAVTQEKHFLTGTGANQPLGVMTASANGIPTSRDVSTGNATTAFTADGLMECFYSCKAPYRNNGVWIFHRDGVKMARKLKYSGTGEYIWQPGLQGGGTDTIFNRPVFESEYQSNTFTTGLYVGIFGDFSYYWIAEALNMEVQVVDQLYAATNQYGYFGRLELDAMPVLGEAFARVKLA